MAEDEAGYDVSLDEPSMKPTPPLRRVSGTGNRLLLEIRNGKALDNARRLDGSTARDVGPPEPGLEGEPATDNDSAAVLSERLHLLARAHDCDLAEQLTLLLRFDALKGWRSAGCSSCLSWMNQCLGIGRSASYERLSVARELESLPLLRALFRVGKLSWSKIRLLVRIADAENEERLALAALHLSVSATEALCRNYRHPRSSSEEEDNARACDAFAKRSLTWRSLDEHSMEIRVRLPIDQGAEIIATLELFEQSLREAPDEVAVSKGRSAAAGVGAESATGAGANADANTNTNVGVEVGASASAGASAVPPSAATDVPETTARQRRVDALRVMAARACTTSDESPASDRSRINLDIRICPAPLVDDPDLSTRADRSATETHSSRLPLLRATLSNFGPVSPAVARRMACDAGLSTTVTDHDGNPLTIGRLTRTWPVAMRRAIVARDGCCQVPGCGARHNLDVHHIAHWADGGETSVSNGVVVCRRCHVTIHEGGFTLERATLAGIREDLIAGLGDLPPMESGAENLDVAVRMIAAVQRFRLLPPSQPSTRVDSCACQGGSGSAGTVERAPPAMAS